LECGWARSGLRVCACPRKGVFDGHREARPPATLELDKEEHQNLD